MNKRSNNRSFVIFIIVCVIIVIISVFTKYLSYHYENSKLIKNIPEVIEFYNKLDNFNHLGLAEPNGKKNPTVLLLLNIATTARTGDQYVYIGENDPIFTLKTIQKSFGKDDTLSRLISSGKVAISDIIPIRLPNTAHIENVPDTIVTECIEFTSHQFIPKTNPLYVFGFGKSADILLKYMQRSEDFTIQVDILSETIKLHKIKNNKKNHSFIFIWAFHPSAVSHSCSEQVIHNLDDVFAYIRNIVGVSNNDVFSFYNYCKDKSMKN